MVEMKPLVEIFELRMLQYAYLEAEVPFLEPR